MRAHPRAGGKYVRIAETGSGRIQGLKAALANGLPVGFGVSVTDSFLSSDGPTIIDKPQVNDPVVGGHAMLIVGYEETSQGLLFDVQNSWSTSWRDGGFCRFTEDHIRWHRARDFQIIYGWKALQNAA